MNYRDAFTNYVKLEVSTIHDYLTDVLADTYDSLCNIDKVNVQYSYMLHNIDDLIDEVLSAFVEMYIDTLIGYKPSRDDLVPEVIPILKDVISDIVLFKLMDVPLSFTSNEMNYLLGETNDDTRDSIYFSILEMYAYQGHEILPEYMDNLMNRVLDVILNAIKEIAIWSKEGYRKYECILDLRRRSMQLRFRPISRR